MDEDLERRVVGAAPDGDGYRAALLGRHGFDLGLEIQPFIGAVINVDAVLPICGRMTVEHGH
ncbi:hypothetical protein [Caulobacter endophyticus]|uniref:hypothetical protein n=1 Tax=Caulobacter endophyticus TaxID=2172652 RepID=UPI001304B396|nr:hypothetical protein [Caulobacter endophyticus]